MRSRDAVGRTIVEVVQDRVAKAGEDTVEVHGFRLDNGTYLSLVATETEEKPIVLVETIRTIRK